MGNDPIHEALVILYVKDQKQATRFYQQALNRKPVLDVPGMTEFQISENFSLGLMPGDGVKRLLGEAIEHPFGIGKEIPRAELYLSVTNPEEWASRAEKSGATVLSPLQERDWGDRVVYLQDRDGNILAFAEHRC